MRAIGHREGHRAAGARRKTDDHRAPRGNLTFGARHERAERRARAGVGIRTARGTVPAVLLGAAGFGSPGVVAAGAAVETAAASTAPATRFASFCRGSAAASGGCGRSRASGQRVDQIARPGVGDDHSARRQHDEDRRAPEADGVVPVEVASLAAQPEADERHRAHVPPRPLPRPPQIEARHRQHEKGGVARAGDRARRRAVLALDREVAVPAGDRSIEAPAPEPSRSEHVAGVGIDEDRSALPERDRRRHARIGIERHRRWLGIGNGLSHPRQERLDIKTCRAWAGGSTNRCDRSTTLSTDCWNVSSVPVTDMIRMTVPATSPAVRIVQNRSSSFMIVDVGSALDVASGSRALGSWLWENLRVQWSEVLPKAREPKSPEPSTIRPTASAGCGTRP